VKTVAWLAGIGTAVAALAYMVISLNRWEWNRALFFGLIVLIAEVGLATAMVLRKLAQIQYGQQHPPDPAIRAILRASRPPSPDRFAWLHETTTRTNVFITFLVGGGVLLSGLAWLMDRVASKTSTPVGEQLLGRQLDAISYPQGGMLVDDVTVLAQDVPGADDAQIRKLLRRAGHT
jgi:hypothetical protein